MGEKSDPYEDLESDESAGEHNGSLLVDIDLGLTAYVTSKFHLNLPCTTFFS